MFARAFAQFVKHILLAPRILIRAFAGERVIHVGDGHHAPKKRDFFSSFATRFAVFISIALNRFAVSRRINMPRIARAVPAFMMIQGDLPRDFVKFRLRV